MKERFVGKYVRGLPMQAGSSTLEILIAFAVLIVTFTAVIQLFFTNQMLPVDTQTNIEALYRAQAQLEAARSTSFASLTNTDVATDDIYIKSLAVSQPTLDPNSKTVTSNTSWVTGARNLAVQLSTLMTSDPATHGSTCNPVLTIGDWKRPAYASFYTVDLVSQAISGNSSGLSIADIYVYAQKLYLAVNKTAASDTTNSNVYIFNLHTDPTQEPTYLARIPTTGYLSNAITVAPYGSKLYAYVLSAKSFNFTTCISAATCPHMQVIDVTVPTNPMLVPGANIELPITGSSGQGIGNVMYYSNGYVYIGIQKPASGPEFGIVDVGGGTASPTHPVLVGTYNMGGYTITSIAVSGNYAYISSTDITSSNKQLAILDVSNKSTPLLAGHYTAAITTGFNGGYGYTVTTSGNDIYFGRSYLSGKPNFYIFDGTTPSSLSTRTSKSVGTSDSVRGINVRGKVAFLMTNNQFQMWDVSNPSSIVPYTPIGTTAGFLNLSSVVAGILGATYSGSTVLTCTGNLFLLGLTTTTSGKDVLSVLYPSS